MATHDPLPKRFLRSVLRKEVSMLEAWAICALIEEAEQEGKQSAMMPPNLLPACRILGLVDQASE